MWDESKVTRGQPENAGEFASKGGGGGQGERSGNGDLHTRIKTAIEAASAPARSPADDYKTHGTRAKAFKAWFGDWEADPAGSSKVVDAQGEPQETHGTAKIVFHGTHATFDAFDSTKKDWSCESGKGFYFSDNANVATRYAAFGGGARGKIISAYLKIQKPLDLDTAVPPQEKSRIIAAAGGDDAGLEANCTGAQLHDWLTSKVGPNAVNDVIAKAGFDGLTHVAKNGMGGRTHESGDDYGRTWIAFEPNQIKSVGNQGTFNPQDNRMDYSRSAINNLKGVPKMSFVEKLAQALRTGVERYGRTQAVERYAGAWDESKHPRGNEKNAGQFTAGQGVQVGASAGSKIKGGAAKVVSGPHTIGGVSGQYLVDQNGVQEHHHESRLKPDKPGQAYSGTTGRGNPAEAVADAHKRILASPGKSNLTADQMEENGKDMHFNHAGLQQAFKGFKDSGKAIRQYHEAQQGGKPQAGAQGQPAGVQKAMQEQDTKDTTSPPPGGYAPNPADGKAARVGVPGNSVPPPPKKIPQLNNLTPDERQIETQYAQMFEQDPDGMADKMIAAMANGMGDGPNIFATDEAKGLFPQWKGNKVPVIDQATGQQKLDKKGQPEFDLSPETKEFRSKYNTSMHQTANALAKRAFIRYMDTVVAKLPPDKKHILVTAGGVAAGKGFAIDNVEEVKRVSNMAAATWDSAGEQNSTELDWLAGECAKRGVKMTAVFVHSNPAETWENPDRGVIERAGKKGRMVDARPFADSYTYGAQNFHKFASQHKGNPNIDTMVLDNTRPPIPDMDPETGKQKLDKKGQPAMKPDVQFLPQVPQEMLSMSPEHLYSRCLTALESAPAPQAVKDGGSAGVRIWGPPNTGDQPQKTGAPQK